MTGIGTPIRFMIFLGAVATVAAIAQGNLGFLTKMPAGNFDKNDWALLKGAVREVLSSEEQDAARAWRNDNNGHGGNVRVVKNYKGDDGKQCRQVQVESSAGGRNNTSVLSACRDTDGIWRATDGTPLTFSPVSHGSILG
jgi:surface antigen